MLKELRENYNRDKFQFILTDLTGRVVQSDQTLLSVEENVAIGEAHPFFLSIPEIMDAGRETATFHCVQLGTPMARLTADIEIHRKKDGFLIVIEDLTQHYRSYQKMAQTRNESIIDSELIVLKNHELQERERFKNEFIQNFSHELRNPLTNIIALTNILQRTDLSEEQLGILAVLKDSTSNLKLMLEDILSIAMIAKGKLALNPSVFNFPHFIEFLKLTYTTRAKEKGLAFSVTTDEKIPEYLEGDRIRLLQVLTNLCDNAVKYTKEGTISLHVALNQKRANTASLRFSVKDTGPGIPPESLGTILESFEQLGQTEGVGLGLAIVKGLLDLMGSTIKIESEVGRGSHFYFDLKLQFPLREPIRPAARKHLPPTKAKAPAKDTQKYRVLLVEDNEQVQTSLFKSLIEPGNFFIDVVSDGALVMQEVVNSKYDIILMDVNLPNITGDQLTKAIRAFPFKDVKKIPIIGITANSYKAQIKAYKKAGMNAVITKPFEQNELLKTMQRLLK
ncbi:ATP-binding response regulator [Pseudozobellia thermophila]|uniref:histidine kinase n=1 Tax=Pseudozobellia thermophila TaxID=192903 RepID=A0A1M6B557_9FLAO|nr:ATP-binding protein [Pseudozobellia thermophila]SHI43708.1 Signal transduction histidine kinase [Pseudozobellia thermophila]